MSESLLCQYTYRHILMPYPLNPDSSPSLKPQTVEEKVNAHNEFQDVKYGNRNKTRYIFLENILLTGKKSLVEGIKENVQKKTDSLALSKPNINSTCNKTDQKIQKPNIFSKLNVLFSKRPSFLGSKMSDKPGRPMKYPYTLTAKIAQFPYKLYFNNNWMFKYYIIAVAVSFPLFYKLGRISRTPENVKTWDEIRKRDFTPGGHH